MKWYLKILKEGFKGRLNRIEYLCFLILLSTELFLAAPLDRFLGLDFWEISSKSDSGMTASSYDVGYIWSLVVLVHTMPALGASVRRMHDISKSGWHVLIPIYNLILIFSKGSEGENVYGVAPKEENYKVNFRLFALIIAIIILLTWFFDVGATRYFSFDRIQLIDR